MIRHVVWSTELGISAFMAVNKLNYWLIGSKSGQIHLAGIRWRRLMKCLKADIGCWCCLGRAECSWLLAGGTPAFPHLQGWPCCFPGGDTEEIQRALRRQKWARAGSGGGRDRALEVEPLQLTRYECCRLGLWVWGTKQSSRALFGGHLLITATTTNNRSAAMLHANTLSNLISLEMSLLIAGGWTRGALKVPSNPNYSMIQWNNSSASWKWLSSFLDAAVQQLNNICHPLKGNSAFQTWTATCSFVYN